MLLVVSFFIHLATEIITCMFNYHCVPHTFDKLIQIMSVSSEVLWYFILIRSLTIQTKMIIVVILIILRCDILLKYIASLFNELLILVIRENFRNPYCVMAGVWDYNMQVWTRVALLRSLSDKYSYWSLTRNDLALSNQ